MSKIFNLIFCAILLAVGAYGGMKISNSSVINTVRTLSAAELKHDIQGAQELATASYAYEAIGKITDEKTLIGIGIPGTKKRLFIRFQGLIKYGYDLSALKESDIKVQDKKITIKLPAPKVLSNEIDISDSSKYEVLIRDDRVLNNLKTEDTIEAADQAKKKGEERANVSSFLKKTAEDNAKKTFTIIVKGYSRDYEVSVETK